VETDEYHDLTEQAGTDPASGDIPMMATESPIHPQDTNPLVENIPVSGITGLEEIPVLS
jgi:hypothetical protein